MFVFEYPKDWADLIVAQLAASADSRHYKDWGYAALLVGKEWEKFINDHYEVVDEALGRHLHLFSLLPAPTHLLTTRLQTIRAATSVPGSKRTAQEYLVRKIQAAIRHTPPDPGTQIKEKVRLLSDLKNAGLEEDEYASFLFFKFRDAGDAVDLDVIAARVPFPAQPSEALALLKSAGAMASNAHADGANVERFVGMLQVQWTRKIRLQEARQLFDYVAGFLNHVRALFGQV